ncbi:MAG: HD domain-containing protein [Bacteroides sp.]|nr:HD domain-containing protein [Bacteroides sp.]MCM1379631.1 HD domain-containing protein [Bacteroides sp.]MCM1445987.1 HD domain-containing protein [Prevotella sp.]
MEPDFFTSEESQALVPLYRSVRRAYDGVLSATDAQRLRSRLSLGIAEGHYGRNRFGHNLLIHRLQTVNLMASALSPDRSMAVALLLAPLNQKGFLTPRNIEEEWGEDILKLVTGLNKVDSLYERTASVEDENFRNLLLTFAQDIRVIITVIVERMQLMRAINHHPDQEAVKRVAAEARYLYAPLAHRLGLYAIKGELEDLSLKYSNREVFTRIAHDLNQRKAARDAYIADFIAPVKAKLEAAGLKFDIKGRTKSISSIWNKIQKQHNDLDHIYDLFAIRVIIDTPPEREKADCWLAYSVVTDMYRPNPARMKDWISIPKTNGYESLHITVAGPQERWVEVQIRTRRMDLIAEKGLAAHWRYKGIKGENGLDQWMNNIRDILETADSGPLELMKNMSMDIYSDEVFVFTPRGDLHRLPKGATVLDFAFSIHTKLGCQCTGGRINGKNRKINHRLQSGDTVEINTSAQQNPTADWLQFVVTSKARTKIRQVLNEARNRHADIGRETLERRAKNRKIDLDEPTLMRFIKKMGYKTVTDFFAALGVEELDANRVLEQYADFAKPEELTPTEVNRSAENFVMQQEEETSSKGSGDVLIIGSSKLKGMNYKLARCCNPIYGDDVFGFISSDGVVKIHRADCPNAQHIRERYPYRIIETRWSGSNDTAFPATLSVMGVDDIGIVTNISSIINKERDIQLRNIAIDSNDGLFRGTLTVGVNSTAALNALIKKIKTIKGVKNVERSK